MCVILGPIFAWGFFSDEIMLRFDLYKCVKSGECIYKEFNGGKYLVKNKASEEFIPYLLKYPAVVNTKTGIIHRDGCSLGKACTKNCVYIEEAKAFKMLKKNSLMHYCKVESMILDMTDEEKYLEYCVTNIEGNVDYNCVEREIIYDFFEKNTIQDVLKTKQESTINASQYRLLNGYKE
jgi:hypothetical protein